MATERVFQCPSCRTQVPAASLFEALRSVAESAGPACFRCKTSMVLHLNFDFGLGAQGKAQIVSAAYLPQKLEQWENGGDKVTHYPFLVVAREPDGPQSVWLPYWHLVKTRDRVLAKYGQWAPFMSRDLFAELVMRARNDGWLV